MLNFRCELNKILCFRFYKLFGVYFRVWPGSESLCNSIYIVVTFIESNVPLTAMTYMHRCSYRKHYLA
jgi:hypothetical protein